METLKTREMIEHMIKELQAPIKELTDWEFDFMSSISTKFELVGDISDKQFRVLERIYTEKTA